MYIVPKLTLAILVSNAEPHVPDKRAFVVVNRRVIGAACATTGYTKLVLLHLIVSAKWYMLSTHGEGAGTHISNATTQRSFYRRQGLPSSPRLWLKASQKQQCGAQQLLHIVHQVAVMVEKMRGSGAKSRCVRSNDQTLCAYPQ
jgi:hypothetical protein